MTSSPSLSRVGHLSRLNFCLPVGRASSFLPWGVVFLGDRIILHVLIHGNKSLTQRGKKVYALKLYGKAQAGRKR